jgi:hypothetical protein
VGALLCHFPQACANKIHPDCRRPWSFANLRDKSGAHAPLLRKTFAAEDRTILRWAERNRGFLAALGASGAGFHAGIASTVPIATAIAVGRIGAGRNYGNAPRLTHFTAFGLVLELLIVEEQLFAGRKDKAGAAVDAGKNFVLKFH